MAKDGYQWWRQRLSHMAQYFTAYRVDHVLGFFRVYEVPERHVTGASSACVWSRLFVGTR